MLLFCCTWGGELSAADPQRLTSDGRVKRGLVWLPGGEDLVFSQQDEPQLFRLYRLHLADGQITPLHSSANTSEFEAAFAPDGHLCGYVQSVGNLSLKLMLQPFPEGTSQTLVNPGGGFAGIRSPTFFSDGSRVVYSVPLNGGQQICSVDLKGENRQELTKTAGINAHPTCAPVGMEIAFDSSRDENFEIYTMQGDGTRPRRLTDHPAMDIRPHWSPDARQLVFVSNRDGNYELYVIPYDGGEPVNLTNDPERDDYPAWHPDGKSIAYISIRAGQSDIYLRPAP